MNIIFLDIDGVLNNEIEFVKLNKELDYPLDYLHSNNIYHLNKIIEETGSKCVISSSWRKSTEIDEMQRLLELKGFKGEIIDSTIISEERNRGKKIKHWLDNNQCDKYLILDDDTFDIYNLVPENKNNFIKVNSLYGINEEIVKESIEHFK